MSFKKLAILAIAGLTAACGAPTQSANPAALQPAAVSNGRMRPDVTCDFVKLEPTIKTLKVHEQLGITPILRIRSNGDCESAWLPATWNNTGGKLLIRKAGKEAIFSAAASGTYSVTAQVSYGTNTYTGQSTVIVLH